MSIALQSVGHRFGRGPWLFRSLNFTFDPGRTYALTGPSGSGKSTLLSMLAGLESPREGAVVRDDEARVAWVFQNPFGSPRRSALDHVALPLLGRGASTEQAEHQARALLRRLDLDTVSDTAFGALSGGQAQRLMLARGIAANPGLLLVDEPTAQLDRTSAATVDAVLGLLAHPTRIVIVATHDRDTQSACTDLFDLGEHARGAWA